MSKIAVLFPGQGAQFVGMGRVFYDTFSVARAVFDQAASVLGDALLDTIFNGPEEALQKTETTQPAILTTSIAVYRVLEDLGCRADRVAGLSLGEYSALVAAGALSLQEALPLVQKRGRYMQEAVPLGQGSMAAVMGLSKDQIEAVCREASSAGVVTPANYNCPGQVVISGGKEAVQYALTLAREAGAKKMVELKVSAPFHCALMEPVEQRLAGELNKVNFSSPRIPVVFNVSASYESDPARIKENLVKQVSHPILWEQSMRLLYASGLDAFIDVGPGSTLAKLMKRIEPSVYTAAVEDSDSLGKVCRHLEGAVI
jgi:[acyl-carrier-protein] S-malonyltransferase